MAYQKILVNGKKKKRKNINYQTYSSNQSTPVSTGDKYDYISEDEMIEKASRKDLIDYIMYNSSIAALQIYPIEKYPDFDAFYITLSHPRMIDVDNAILNELEAEINENESLEDYSIRLYKRALSSYYKIIMGDEKDLLLKEVVFKTRVNNDLVITEEMFVKYINNFKEFLDSMGYNL